MHTNHKIHHVALQRLNNTPIRSWKLFYRKLVCIVGNNSCPSCFQRNETTQGVDGDTKLNTQ